MAPGTAHFRAHDRRAVRLPVELQPLHAPEPSAASGRVHTALVVDLSIAGAGLETEEILTPGERLVIVLATPTTWDPIVLEAVVAWSQPPRPVAGPAGYNRTRPVARAGVAFAHAEPASVLAVFEVLATLGYE
ncbi:MAG: hypothetical protein JWP97_2904 [Labilithrix sp.]|nr:hypothetical protein [Labilithrix sp.]